MTVRNINLIKYDSLIAPMEALTKIRYKDPGTMSTITQIGNEMSVLFHQPVTGIAPGQSAVFYDGDDVIWWWLHQQTYYKSIIKLVYLKKILKFDIDEKISSASNFCCITCILHKGKF